MSVKPLLPILFKDIKGKMVHVDHAVKPGGGSGGGGDRGGRGGFRGRGTPRGEHGNSGFCKYKILSCNIFCK